MKTRNKTIKDSETSYFLTNKIMKPCGNRLPTKVSKLWNSFSLLGVLFLFFNIPVHTLFDSQFFFFYLFIFPFYMNLCGNSNFGEEFFSDSQRLLSTF